LQGLPDGRWIAGMSAAGNARRRDKRKQCQVIGTALAQVGIEVDGSTVVLA
jgi:hypothetical protein